MEPKNKLIEMEEIGGHGQGVGKVVWGKWVNVVIGYKLPFIK